MTRFRRTLKLWQRYEVQTRLLCWDDRWFYFEHKFVDAAGRNIAVGFSQAALRGSKGWADTHYVANTVAPGATSPDIPAHIQQWLESDNIACKLSEQTSNCPSPVLVEATS